MRSLEKALRPGFVAAVLCALLSLSPLVSSCDAALVPKSLQQAFWEGYYAILPASSVLRVLPANYSYGEQGQALSGEENKSCRARQVHLALTGDETEMLISWATTKKGCGFAVSVALASSSTDDDSEDAAPDVEGSSYDLHSHTGCDVHSGVAPLESNKVHLHLHNAVLTNLKPGAHYTYSIDNGGFSGKFTAAPKPSAEGSFTFLAYGDMGEPEDHSAKSPHSGITSRLINAEVKAGGVAMILHVGDLAYAHGKTKVWDAFMEQIEPMSAAIPYMVSVGNYEYDYKGESKDDPSGAKHSFRPSWWNGQNDSGGECGLPCAMRFQMPGQRGSGALHGTYAGIGGAPLAAAAGESISKGPESNAPFWYHFAYHSVHFVLLSGEHDIREGSVQYKWLKDLLESGEIDRRATPWLIVGIHRPLYVPYPHHSNRKVARHLRRSLEPLFSKHKVDVVISGHVHSYTRSCPVFNWDCVSLGIEEQAAVAEVEEGEQEEEEEERAPWTWSSVLRLPSRSGSRKELVPDSADDDDEHDTCHGKGDDDDDSDEAGYRGPQDDAIERWGNHSGADVGNEDDGSGPGYGTTHLVIGTGGHFLSPVSHKQPAWVQSNAISPGYGRFRVEGSKRIVFEFVDALEEKVTDRVEIVNRP